MLTLTEPLYWLLLGMMIHAWAGYERFAWGENELKPLSQTGNRVSILGPAPSGATIVDSLGLHHNILGLQLQGGGGGDGGGRGGGRGGGGVDGHGGGDCDL